MKLTHFKHQIRRGPDTDVEPATFQDIQHLEMGNLRVGRWVTQEENACSQSYLRLSGGLGLSTRPSTHAIGLRGTLNFAFGTGGRQACKPTTILTDVSLP